MCRFKSAYSFRVSYYYIHDDTRMTKLQCVVEYYVYCFFNNQDVQMVEYVMRV